MKEVKVIAYLLANDLVQPVGRAADAPVEQGCSPEMHEPPPR